MSMERNGLNMKDDDGGGVGVGVGVGGSVGGSKRLEDSKVKDSWGYHRPDSISSGLLGGFSWPPRSYTCSFCKREFTSAQALGGHMNVHRRDRAKLRQWPPWDVKSSNPDPNPNPNFVPSSTAGSGAGAATRIPQFTNTFTSSLLSSVACFSSSSSSSELNMLGSISPCVLHPLFPKVDDSKGTEALLGVRELKGFVEDQKDEMCVRLDLEIGLCGDLKEDLDLELRLGHS